MGIRKFLRYSWRIIKDRLLAVSWETKKYIAVFMVALAIGFLLGGRVFGEMESNKAEKELKTVTAQLQKEGRRQVEEVQEKLDEALNEEAADLPWYLVLVNHHNKMNEGYEPQLAELEPGYSVDVRILEAAEKMLADAKADGMGIDICSAYRSVNRQEQLFTETLKEYLT